MSRIILVAVISGICLIMAVVILMGKGDGLIAGYNTSGANEKEQYNMPRLRGIVAAILLGGAALPLLLLFIPGQGKVWAVVVFLVLTVAGVVLANTGYCKKG